MGVNRFVEDEPGAIETLRVDPESERRQVQRLQAFKTARDKQQVARRLQEVADAAAGTANMLPVLRQALKDGCSVGEVCGAMAEVFGNYQPGS